MFLDHNNIHFMRCVYFSNRHTPELNLSGKFRNYKLTEIVGAALEVTTALGATGPAFRPVGSLHACHAKGASSSKTWISNLGAFYNEIKSTLILFLVSRDSSVGIALGYGLDDRGSRVRFPARAGNFSLHHRVQNGSGAHPASYPMGTRGSFPGGKAAGA
jgi:hypothetical protein